MKARFITLLCCFSLILAGCASGQATSAPVVAQPTSAPVEPTQAEPTAAPVEPTSEPTQPPPTDTPLPPTDTPEPALEVLPAEPQRIEFQTEDGATLVGLYYPAAANPAPVVVLMHWAGGDKNDWIYVGMAAWLQNRGLDVPAASQGYPFDTPYPFPPLPEGLSFGVFAFDFRGFGESEKVSGGFSEMAPLWLLDAEAAYATAQTLSGADPSRVAGIGASIGADAVVDGCGELCAGALSLGPGNYLDVAYGEAVKVVDDISVPVWCVGAEDDPPAVMACNSAEGDHYFKQIYAQGGHAMELFRAESNLDPLIEQVILDFLTAAFGLE